MINVFNGIGINRITNTNNILINLLNPGQLTTLVMVHIIRVIDNIIIKANVPNVPIKPNLKV